jgi:hypothetical protein
MKLRISFIILLLVWFVPFEVIILKHLPVSDIIYGYLRFLVEVLIYLIAGFVFARYLNSKKLPKGTPLDRPLILFIGYSLIITIINNAPMFEAFVGLRVLLRYVPLFYILSFIEIDSRTIRKIFNSIMIIAVIQCTIATYQHYFGIATLWYPRASDLEIGGKQVGFRLLTTGFSGGRELGAGIGTFGDSVFLALFLVISFTMLVASLQRTVRLIRIQKLVIIASCALIIIVLFFTYSRGSVLVAAAAIPIIMLLDGGSKRLAAYFTIGLIFMIPIVFFGEFTKPSDDASYINPKVKYTDPLSNITTVFTSSYLNNTMQFSRGAVLTEIGGNLIGSFKLLGYSPAQEFALEKAATKLFGSNMPINNLPIINDVYWVAFIIYYGIFGLGIYFFVLYQLFRAARFVYHYSDDPYFRIFALTLAALVIISIPYSLILRTFVFRSFGFYFWLIAGLVMSEWRRLKLRREVEMATS